MTTPAYDLRKLIIKRDLESALKTEGDPHLILNDDERSFLNKYYCDRQLVTLLREVIINKELLEDTKVLLQQSERELMDYYQDPFFIYKIKDWNQEIVSQIENGNSHFQNIYELRSNDRKKVPQKVKNKVKI